MENLLNAADIKRQVSLVDLLAKLGFKPIRQTGKELLYFSMLRDGDTKPSFAVNEELNVWFDHGAGKGGNIVDFGVAYWPGNSFLDVLRKIRDTSEQEIIPSENTIEQAGRRRRAVKIPHYEVEEIKELGNSAPISYYLSSRGIREVAEGKLKEVYYFVEDQKKLKKHFYASGWQNELGGWEVRNKYFKGCLGHKAVTFIEGSVERLAIFEGYFDYLSWLIDNPADDSSILVLNSLSLIEVGIRRAKEFAAVDLYFDRDKAGHEASKNFINAVPNAIDRSVVYDGFADYNDRIKSGLAEPTPFIVQQAAEPDLRSSFVR